MIWLLSMLVAGAEASTEEQNARLVERKPRATSMLLQDMLAEADAAEQLQIRYWLARSFERIELYHVAQRYHLAVVGAGESRWQASSLIALVELADRIGDDTDLSAALVELGDAVSYPPQVASSLQYLRGVGLHRTDPAAAISAYEAVSYGDPRYFSARHRLAVALYESGQPEAARDVLISLLSTRPFGTRIQQQDARRIQALALVNLARLYHASGRYEEAELLYAQVHRKSPWRAVATLEGGWSALLSGSAAGARSAGEAASLAAYLPEGEILAASAALQVGGCEAAQPRLASFLDAHRPMRDELLRTARMSGEEQWDWWFSERTTAERALPASFFLRLLQDQQLAGAIYRMDRIERERALIAAQPEEWVLSVGAGLSVLLDSDHATATARTHNLLAARTDTLRAELDALVAEAEAMQAGCADMR